MYCCLYCQAIKRIWRRLDRRRRETRQSRCVSCRWSFSRCKCGVSPLTPRHWPPIAFIPQFLAMSIMTFPPSYCGSAKWMGGFHTWGHGVTPSHHPFLDWDFPNKNPPAIGVSPWRAGNPQLSSLWLRIWWFKALAFQHLAASGGGSSQLPQPEELGEVSSGWNMVPL